MIEGKVVRLDGQEYLVPPLNFRQLQQFESEITALRGMKDLAQPTMEDLNKAIPVIAAALSRNYPSLDLERVRDLVDLRNYKDLVEAAFAVGDFKMPEDFRMGEERPAPLIGARSTLSSSPEPDGRGST